jgi:hypothetical protein
MGLINDKAELKILLLLLLRRLGVAVRAGSLMELALGCDGELAYLEVMECLEELRASGHVSSGRDGYAILEKGLQNCEATVGILPGIVRARAERAAAEARSALRRPVLVRAGRTVRREGGYTVHMSLSDGYGEIMALELLTADNDQAEELEAAFRIRAEAVYECVLRALLDDLPSESPSDKNEGDLP